MESSRLSEIENTRTEFSERIKRRIADNSTDKWVYVKNKKTEAGVYSENRAHVVTIEDQELSDRFVKDKDGTESSQKVNNRITISVSMTQTDGCDYNLDGLASYVAEFLGKIHEGL